MTLYLGTSRFLRSSFFFGSATMVAASASSSAKTVSSASMMSHAFRSAEPKPTVGRKIGGCRTAAFDRLSRAAAPTAVVKRLRAHYIVRPLEITGSSRQMDAVKSYIKSHRDKFERDLSDLLRIASVSADSRQNAETKRAGDWVAGQFKSLGLATETIPTAGHPLVYAESPPVAGKPGGLVHGH